MKLLYVASDQVVPGDTGGSVHVLEVARGLAARGHEVHAVIRERRGRAAPEEGGDGVWHRIRWCAAAPLLPLPRAAAGERDRCAGHARQAVMERYYNFGGEGIRAAAALGSPRCSKSTRPSSTIRGSLKGLLDAACSCAPAAPLPRARSAAQATALVCAAPGDRPRASRAPRQRPSPGAPTSIASARTGSRGRCAGDWGVPAGRRRRRSSRGSFRPWHGVDVLERRRACWRTARTSSSCSSGADPAGPAHGLSRAPAGTRAVRADARMARAAADIGVAPYDTPRLAQLRLGFYWSPLKIFEYMASGLPTVTIPRPPLTEIVRDGRGGAALPGGRRRRAGSGDRASRERRCAAATARATSARRAWSRRSIPGRGTASSSSASCERITA